MRHNYEPIEIITSNKQEKDFFISHCPGIVCNVIDANLQGYPLFSYKPFVLSKYMNEIGIQHKGRNVVVCDADILWKQDPVSLFERFEHTNWVHKITAVSPLDYEIPMERIPLSNIGLRTIQNCTRRGRISVYPNFVLNAGLFMLAENVFSAVLKNWLSKVLKLPSREMLMSEALMSLTYTEMGLHPISDRENIKHLGVERAKTTLRVLNFEIAPPRPRGTYTGYETARHYYGDQRDLLHKDAVVMGLDYDNFLAIVKKHIILRHIKKLPTIPSKTVHRFKGIWRKISS